MAKKVIPLTNTQVKQAKPKDKQYKLSDGDGLQLRVKPSGSKTWLLDYYHPYTKKRQSMSFGSYPEVSLSAARGMRANAKELLSQQIDPKAHRDETTETEKSKHLNTLENVANQWLDTIKDEVTPKYAEKVIRTLEIHVFNQLGKYPVHTLTATKVIDVFSPLVTTGKFVIIKRCCQLLNRVMNFAVNTGMVDHNRLSQIGDAFKSPKGSNMATLKPDELPELMKAIHSSDLNLITRYCLEWQLHTMVRPSEAAKATWEEIDFSNGLWVISGERMKMKKDHVVPLSSYCLKLLEQLKLVSGHRVYLFPSKIDSKTHVNTETTNKALRRIGFQGRLVAHGLRSLASTTLNEQGFDPDVIESALAHTDKNSVRRAYNHADYLERRRPVMEWWSNHIYEASYGNMSLAAGGAKGLKVVGG
ncbi:tyrosine-type recombinase/integrase [Psychrosphaera sp. B3R10]|uniref:integrase domain-containing protein n=1 Tax=unclassified Psychrosphaera TaxID=2641570 RepID=UPI001C0A2899|nr:MULTISPECIES: integrase domain-containing protein [unclassified Psychrosphaera]MBU2883006.1 tyrosine-type recombinase/integrase [Psychrosphaera sp. I2R16]MBU2991403.1 tyrosine-type recombinase/integrase [Psychrosphaera sp. B3R10]